MPRLSHIAVFFLTLTLTLGACAHPFTAAAKCGKTHVGGYQNEIGVPSLESVRKLLSFMGKPASNRTSASGKLFTGEQFDPNLGWYYLRARYYSPSVGRFPTMDSFPGLGSHPLTLNKYLYAEADAINRIDPSGHLSLAEINSALRVAAKLAIQGTGRIGRLFIKRVRTATLRAASAMRTEILRCMRKPRKCRINVPFIITGGDLPETARHILDSQIGNGRSLIVSPFFLNYANRGGNRKWYNATPYCSEVSRNAFAIRNGSRAECDEYPYFKTKQGGKKNFNTLVSVRLIKQGEGSRQGNRFNTFLGTCKLRTRNKRRNSFVALAMPNLRVSTGSHQLGLCPVRR